VPERWERYLERWLGAGLIEPAAGERIRAYEAQQAGLPKWRWPVVIAVGLGSLLVAAGVLLFVAAHWDRLSATARFVSVLLLVGAFHLAGALVVERFSTPGHGPAHRGHCLSGRRHLSGRTDLSPPGTLAYRGAAVGRGRLGGLDSPG
jgi:uncharacterized membrane protein